MLPLLIIKDDRFTKHLESIPHLENARRVEAIHSVLKDPSLGGKWMAVAPRFASRDELAMVHTPRHIERIEQTSGRPLSSFDLDTQATEESYDVARLAVGSTFSLLDQIWGGKGKRGFACVRPPGHHAEPNKAMGFCLFNNIALAARYLKESYGVRKVMIVDVDVHHGNGTQAAFYNTDEVLFVSMHQFPAYPGTGNIGEVGQGDGEGYTVNIPLGRGYGDRQFAQIIYFLVYHLAKEYEPEMMLISCGFDLYSHDRLGEMKVSPQGYALMTFFLLEIAERVCDGRILFVMEGGYSLKGIRECGIRVLQEMCDVPTLTREKIRKISDSSHDRLEPLKKVIELQKKYWKSLR